MPGIREVGDMSRYRTEAIPVPSCWMCALSQGRDTCNLACCYEEKEVVTDEDDEQHQD